MEFQCRIVNSIQADLETHIVDLDIGITLEILVSDRYQKRIDPFIFPLDNRLRKHQSHIRMDSSIRDPVLLRLHCRTIDRELLFSLIINGCGLHHYSIVPITQFSQAKTTCDLKTVNHVEKILVSFCVQGHNTTA